MLHTLTIENYALIDHLEFCPSAGLNVITGETGAGKSIIMGALGLILGQRADAKAVRNGATKCVIEATFGIANYGLKQMFDDNELDYDEDNTIVRREIYATGKSRAFVNDSPVQLSVLKQLGDALIDIHSQHQNLLIGKGSFQQQVLDTLAGNRQLLADYRLHYNEMCRLDRKLRELKDLALRDAQEADYMRFQFAQLDDANLQDGELEQLENEQDMLGHAEEIKSGLSGIFSLLDDDGNSVVQSLKRACDEARQLSRIYPSISEIADRIESDYIDIKDIAGDIDAQAEDVTFDPERLAAVEERLSLIYSLQKKHGCESVADLISLRDELDQKLQHIDNSDEEIAEAQQQLDAQLKVLGDAALQLTRTRKDAAKRLEAALVEKMTYLGMPNVRFEVQITPLKSFSPSGSDEIVFLFSANKNQPLKPADEVASGGEISRLMLSIKALIASARTLPTIIFDEIDTGVSGDIADRMGEVMKQMSQHLQVITITHLPQVAGKGNAHFLVYKEDDDTSTTTHINQLSADDRVREIARMLSGSKITEQAIANAQTLLR
ncbi:MAG: DNA repair protein RecN [Bacteroidales bacterium]|nr:DNA repair protein RecN [Candidatus Liminaster caballi]